MWEMYLQRLPSRRAQNDFYWNLQLIMKMMFGRDSASVWQNIAHLQFWPLQRQSCLQQGHRSGSCLIAAVLGPGSSAEPGTNRHGSVGEMRAWGGVCFTGAALKANPHTHPTITSCFPTPRPSQENSFSSAISPSSVILSG